jgi:crotonobetainyl-CoA:carnitine CoA-transferase CaiB-like acyl-CoA transferase
MNRNKRSLTLDPMTPEGREVVKRLVRTADVVIANLPERTLAQMGLDYESLKSTKADIILTTVSAFGGKGPMSGYVGFDGVGQAMSGVVYMTGEPDQPYRASVAWVDFGTALHCAFGTLIALMERKRSGKGQIVKGSLLGTALTLGNAMLIEQGVLGINRKPTGNRGQTAAAGRSFPHHRRLDPVPGDRQAALRALGEADGRARVADRSALSRRHLARRQRQGDQRAHGAVVRRRAAPRKSSRRSARRRSRADRCSRRSRRSIIRRSRRWRSCSRSIFPACRSLRRRRAADLPVEPGACRERTRRCWERTPTQSLAKLATAKAEIAGLRERGVV